MSKIRPMELISAMSGKLCSHSDIYFAERNGTQYTGKICNPYTGDPTPNQLAVRQKFADTIEALNALTTQEKDAYKEAFRKQKKCKTLRGFIFSQLYNQPNN